MDMVCPMQRINRSLEAIQPFGRDGTSSLSLFCQIRCKKRAVALSLRVEPLPVSVIRR